VTFIPALEPAVFVACLAPVVYVDLKQHRIPDLFLALAAALLLALRAAQRSLRVEQLAGAAVGFALFLGLWAASRGRLGFGDVKLSGLVGFLVGAQGWVVAVFLASLGGVLAILLRRLLLRVSLQERVAFAPFLIGGGVASFFISGPLVSLL
jgi:prepilin signal peptidase PulO-like enzyme (type II secretory pathway)